MPRFLSLGGSLPPTTQRLSMKKGPPVLRMGGCRKCRLQFSLPQRYECVNCRIPRLGPRFAATSCRASHAYPGLFPLDTDTGNCRKTCPAIMHPPPLLRLLSAGGCLPLLRGASRLNRQMTERCLDASDARKSHVKEQAILATLETWHGLGQPSEMSCENRLDSAGGAAGRNTRGIAFQVFPNRFTGLQHPPWEHSRL